MYPQNDYNIGYEDASLAAKHLQDLGEQISYTTLLEYIYKNFGIARYTTSEDSYKSAVHDVAAQFHSPQPGLKTHLQPVQEMSNQDAPTAYYI